LNLDLEELTKRERASTAGKAGGKIAGNGRPKAKVGLRTALVRKPTKEIHKTRPPRSGRSLAVASKRLKVSERRVRNAGEISKKWPWLLKHVSDGTLSIADARKLGKLERTRAEAIRQYAKSQGESMFLQNEAASAKLWAERRAGELLAEMELGQGNPQWSQGATIVKLSDIGINKTQSSRWQQTAPCYPCPDLLHSSYVSAMGLVEVTTIFEVRRVSITSSLPRPR
jgi:hypothetical protein